MSDRMLSSLTFFSALGSGLIAGIFFAFSVFVMAALARLPAAQGIAAMQSINVVILNTVFIVVFIGTALACAVLAITSFFRWGEAGSIYLLAGSLIYLIGSFLVTLVFNVPLNDALAAVDPISTKGADVWTQYNVSWVAWNHVRTIATVASLISFVMAFRQLG
ncbi:MULTISPECIES: anthrone oxygenase family protein [unclassified Paenibacillus]|uniref:anthrone oxygenase family protein n=1 Tax=unclassified Paenibacillus TaxID=185978 RepID=UPI00363F4A2B